MGDASTKFFHAHATVKHRRNLIAQLTDDNGQIVYQHQEKANLIWQAFRNRMGTSNFSGISFDLTALLSPIVDLSFLVASFTKVDIDDIVKVLPSDKSPGPDGFNTDFVKKAWSIICEDFYKLCFAFFYGDIFLQSINGSFITLVPKKDDATKVSNYMPISLLNCSIKIITKLLANRLQTILPSLIHQNQYGFIKHRTIQDCIAWALEYVHICHKSKREILILKLDFEKAFDIVEHDYMLQIMEAKGFPHRWLQWMSYLFFRHLLNSP